MDEFLKRYGRWALVAGAAEGLGEAFCLALARKGMNIILVDRQEPAMKSLSGRLESEFNIETLNLHLDLADEEASNLMLEKSVNLDCRLLVYNAAHSLVKPFLEHTEDELDKYLDVNCRTLMHTVYGFVDQLRTHSSGGILMMSSLAGLWGTQRVAAYGATKAFTLNFAEALYHELKDEKIDIMACIAGATATPAYLSTRPEYGLIKPSVMDPRKVADFAIKNLGKKAYCIPGISNKLTYFFMTRILTRKLAAGLINSTMGKMYH